MPLSFHIQTPTVESNKEAVKQFTMTRTTSGKHTELNKKEETKPVYILICMFKISRTLNKSKRFYFFVCFVNKKRFKWRSVFFVALLFLIPRISSGSFCQDSFFQFPCCLKSIKNTRHDKSAGTINWTWQFGN